MKGESQSESHPMNRSITAPVPLAIQLITTRAPLPKKAFDSTPGQTEGAHH